MDTELGSIESVEEAAEAFYRLITSHADMPTVNAALKTLKPHNCPTFLNYHVKTKKFGYEPLINVAAHLQNPALVRRILQEGVDVNLNGTNGYTALIHACLAGNEEIATQLIAAGADVNYYFDFKLYQITPLGACLRHSSGAPGCAHSNLAKLLVSLGADLRTTVAGEGKLPRVKETLRSWQLLQLLDDT